MNLDVWFQAALLTPPRICGLQLLPFSVAHHYILTTAASPYMVGGAAPTVPDLLYALQVCSRTWEANALFLTGRQGVWKAIRWAARQQALSRRGRINFTTASASLSTYIADYTALPVLKEPAKESEVEILAPEEWHLVAGLTRLHFGLSAAWNCAYSTAVCLIDTEIEARGVDLLKSEYDQRLGQYEQAAQAAFAAGDRAELARINAEMVAYAQAHKERRAAP